MLDMFMDGASITRLLGASLGAREGLPEMYGAEWLVLGYAATSHRAQGVTTDTAHVLVDSSMTRENLYVAMTRGRASNRAYVAVVKRPGFVGGSDAPWPIQSHDISLVGHDDKPAPGMTPAHGPRPRRALRHPCFPGNIGHPCRNDRSPPRVTQSMRPFTLELYSSSFCGPCHHARAVIKQALALLPTARFREYNVADIPENAEALVIRSTPTIIVRDEDGNEVIRAEGMPTVNHLLVAAQRAMRLD